MAKVSYTEDNIRSLDWKEHIRMRPGMYIGKLGDGSAPDESLSGVTLATHSSCQVVSTSFELHLK